MSYASLPDTNLCLAATFHVWPAMLGDSLSIVKEITPRAPRASRVVGGGFNIFFIKNTDRNEMRGYI